MSHSGFNPKARWDRHVLNIDNPNPENLNERIEVLAWFKSGKIEPCLFVWKSNEYRIKKITYSWQERRGQEIITYFSVDTGANLYQLSFNNTGCGWRIDKIIG